MKTPFLPQATFFELFAYTIQPKKCVDWIDEQVEARRYFSRSHAIEVLILEKMKE